MHSQKKTKNTTVNVLRRNKNTTPSVPEYKDFYLCIWTNSCPNSYPEMLNVAVNSGVTVNLAKQSIYSIVDLGLGIHYDHNPHVMTLLQG